MTFALIEGNSFYCSWERVFDPCLKGRPVIVLSHNDGCAVARAAEAKALSIRMGEPFFRIRELCKRERVAVFYHTLGHDTDQPQRSVSTTVHLIEAINDTIILVMAAEAGARQIWRDGYRYCKAGVMTDDLMSMDEAQRALFGGFDPGRGGRHMAARDAANARFGRGAVTRAAAGTAKPWETKSSRTGPRTSPREWPTCPRLPEK